MQVYLPHVGMCQQKHGIIEELFEDDVAASVL